MSPNCFQINHDFIILVSEYQRHNRVIYAFAARNVEKRIWLQSVVSYDVL